MFYSAACAVVLYLSCCQGNKVANSKRDNLSKQTNDDAPHLVTSHCDVKKHLDTENTEFY